MCIAYLYFVICLSARFVANRQYLRIVLVAFVVRRSTLLEVITILQASDPIPRHILSVILLWAKENRVTEQHLQQLMTMQDNDNENNNIANT